jgi:hypothetical protein
MIFLIKKKRLSAKAKGIPHFKKKKPVFFLIFKLILMAERNVNVTYSARVTHYT